ncbi:MerR family transcriptional regulator [bacterium]|nr:MerR family transcriptional regulator [candidate division CSSED10-310 bacterium]
MDSIKRYRIGEVSSKLDIPTYVLRFWESEFPELKPEKSAAGQRLYSESDIELIKKIKHLRYEEKLTLTGAKNKLIDADESQYSTELHESLVTIKKGLQEILAALR